MDYFLTKSKNGLRLKLNRSAAGSFFLKTRYSFICQVRTSTRR